MGAERLEYAYGPAEGGKIMKPGDWKIIHALMATRGCRLPLIEVLRAGSPQANIGNVSGLQQDGYVTGRVGSTVVNILDASTKAPVTVTLTQLGRREARKPRPAAMRYMWRCWNQDPQARRAPTAREVIEATAADQRTLDDLAEAGMINGIDPEVGLVSLTAFLRVPLAMRIRLSAKGQRFVPSKR
jgi:hypothetical protein